MALVTTDAAALVEGTARLGISRETPDTDAPAHGPLGTARRAQPRAHARVSAGGRATASAPSPAELTLLAQPIALCDGLAVHPDPQFRMTEAITPYVAEFLTSTPPDS